MMATIVTRGSPRASAPSTSTHRRVTSATLRIGPPSFRNTRSERAKKKAQLLTQIEDLNRGLLAIGDEEAQREVDNLASALEKMNPTTEPLASDLINGKWQLVYTTSASILGANKNKVFQPAGPIYQTIDAESLKARNQETSPLFNRVDATLEPLSDSAAKVVFRTFFILGLIPIKAPASAVGELDCTYLDEDMRISRGDKGNLFVLLMEDPSARL